jgi:hypothetical protein
LAQYLHPVGFRSRSSSFFPLLLFDQRLLLLRPFEGGGVGEREVDGDGDNLRIVFLSILWRPLVLPLLWPPSLLSVVAYVLSVSELSEERLGCRCTSLRRLSNPWLTISAFSPGAVALRQSLASSDLVSTFRKTIERRQSFLDDSHHDNYLAK